jgi:hypothetical protein
MKASSSEMRSTHVIGEEKVCIEFLVVDALLSFQEH